MTKTKTTKRSAASHKTVRKTAPLTNPMIGMTDFGQFFGNNGNPMEGFMSQGKSQFEKISSDANNMSRDGLDALNKSLTIFAKGFEDLVRTSLSLAQNSAEKQTQLIKEALSTKTINEWTEVQNRIAQTNFDDFMAGATQLSEMGVRVFSQTTEPLSNQMTKTMKKASDSVAA